MFRSIRFRLAVWYTVAVVITFGASALAVYTYLSRTLSNSLDQSITSEVRWIAARLDRHVQRRESDDRVQEDIFEHASFYPVKEYIEVIDRTGKMLYHSPNLGEDTLYQFGHLPPGENWSISTVRNFRTHSIRLAIQRTSHATIYLAMPVDTIIAPLKELLVIFAWLTPIVIVIAATGGTLLAKKSFAKINEIIKTAKSITAERLSDRIPEHDTKDEIGGIISTLNEMISRLDHSFQQMKQFSADASHELRTPLSVIRTQLETALDSKVSLAELKDIVANCLDETLRMSGIIENLLLLAKSDAGSDPILREKVELRGLLERMTDESTILASPKSIRVTLHATQQAVILGDEGRLRQMILNLIDNAIKYGRENGSIEISLQSESNIATMIISDDGIGIPEQDISRIFDRFYRVDRARSREFGGAGLGLSIVKWIVEAHNGKIGVRSSVGKGTQFTVSLPVYHEQPVLSKPAKKPSLTSMKTS